MTTVAAVAVEQPGGLLGDDTGSSTPSTSTRPNDGSGGAPPVSSWPDPDPAAWMDRPTSARLADLHRFKVWPLFTWLVIEGRLRPDLELLLAKPGGVDLGVWWAAAHADDVQFANAVAERFGSSPNWARQVIRHTAPVLCLWLGKTLGKTLGELTDDNFDAPPWRPTEPTCEPRPGTGSPGGAWRCASCVSRPRS